MSEKELEHKSLEQSESMVEELKLQCGLLQSKVSDLNIELEKTKLHNSTLDNEISQYKELIK